MPKTNEPTKGIKIYSKYRDYIKENRYLGGLIKTETVIKTDTLANELHIIAPPTDKIFINGKEIKL